MLTKASRPESTESIGGLPIASAGRYSQGTTSTNSSKRLNGTSHTTIRSSWGRWGLEWCSQMAEDVGGQETFGAPGGMHPGAGGVQTTARPRVP